MKIFIFLFYTAHLLTEISAWWLTTPMQPAVRLKTKSDATSLVMQVAKMIELINTASKNNGRNIDQGHSGRYGGLHSKHISRRFELPELEIKRRHANLEPKDVDKETQLQKIADTVRYYVIDNPEVLEEYSNKRNKRKKKKNLERYLMRKKTSSTILDNRSLEAKYFNTDDKLKSYHKNAALKAGSHNSTIILNTTDTFIQTSHHPTYPNFELDGDLEVTNIEPTYNPTLADDDKDNNIKLLRTTEKGNNKPRTDEKNHALPASIYNTNKFKKRTGIKARGKKHKVSVYEDNAHKDDLNVTGLNKLEPQPLYNENDNKNDQVAKKKENKKIDYSKSLMGADNLTPKTVKNEDEKGRKDIQPQHKSKNKKRNKKLTTPVHNITSRKHKKKSNQEREEGHLIHAQQVRQENSHRHHKQKSQKIEKEDNKKNDAGNSEKEIEFDDSDIERFPDGFDRMEYEWNKRHLQYDKYDNLNNVNQQDSNDDEWAKKQYDSDKKDNNRNKRNKKMNKKGIRIVRDRKLNGWESIQESDIEEEEAWLLRNERLYLA